MISKTINRFWKILSLMLLVVFLLSFSKSIDARKLSSPEIEDSLVYLPLSMKNSPWRTVFGAQIENLRFNKILSRSVDAGLNWARLDAFNWAAIEPQRTNPPTYKWDQVDQESIKAAQENGIEVIAIVRGTPAWAQKYPGISCGPINQDELAEFAEFLTALVKRFSVPPYGIKYWELGNEPDVAPGLVSPDSAFGCWGDDSDIDYYGGDDYAEMLKYAYPAIKAADPESKVLNGGLLMDCDDCKPGKFLEGILDGGGGTFFDIVSFHGYPYYGGSSGWDDRGGVVLGKVDFIREQLSSHNLEKPIIHTEGSLLCHPNDTANCPPGDDFYEAQAEYIPKLFVSIWAEGVQASIWYQLNGPGWRFGGLLTGQQEPKPVYNALQFMTQKLSQATYNGRVYESTPVSGYKFTAFKKEYWVLWSSDGSIQTVTLPASFDRVFDKYGDEIAVSSNQLQVNSSPVYVVFNK